MPEGLPLLHEKQLAQIAAQAKGLHHSPISAPTPQPLHKDRAGKACTRVQTSGTLLLPEDEGLVAALGHTRLVLCATTIGFGVLDLALPLELLEV